MHGRPPEDPSGKLKAAARAWTEGRGGFSVEQAADDPLTQAARPEIERRSRIRHADIIEIGLDDVPLLNLFMALATQWRHAGLAGVRTGLDYAAVPATAQLLGIEMTPQRFFDLRTMEGAALDAWLRKR